MVRERLRHYIRSNRHRKLRLRWESWGLALGKGSGITTWVLGCRGLSKAVWGGSQGEGGESSGQGPRPLHTPQPPAPCHGHTFPQDIPRKGSEVSSRLPFPDKDHLPLPSFIHSLCLVTSRPPPHIRQNTSFPHPFLLRWLIPALLPTASCMYHLPPCDCQTHLLTPTHTP